MGVESAVISSCKGDPKRQFSLPRVYQVDFDGKAMHGISSDHDLVEYRGYELDLGEHEGIESFLDFLCKRLCSIADASSHMQVVLVDGLPKKVGKILEEYRQVVMAKNKKKRSGTTS